MFNRHKCDILLNLPLELVMLITKFMDISSLFALSRASKRHSTYRVICTGKTFRPFRVKEKIDVIRVDAISNGYVTLFKWLMTAIYCDCMPMLDKLPYIEKTIECEQIDILKHIFYDGFPYDNMLEYIVEIAAKWGSLKVAKWICAGTKRLTYDAEAFECAIENNHLDVVRYLHEDGCPITSMSFELAVDNNYLDIFKYLCENGGQMSLQTQSYIMTEGTPEMVACLHHKN